MSCWYLSGPMTGMKDFNFPAFVHAKLTLEMQGYDIVSPHEVVVEDGRDWTDYVREDIEKLSRCSGIVMLRGWTRSKGAQLELQIALGLNLPVRFFNDHTGELQDIA